MREREKLVVVDLHAGPAAIELCIHVRHRAKQVQRLIDEMRAEIVEQSAGELRRAALAPSTFRLRTPALESRLEPQHIAERLLGEQTLDRQQLAVPAPVVIDGQQ